MSKHTKKFKICIMDYSDNSVTFLERDLPSDIQTEELAELLTIEGIFKSTECSLMYSENINIKWSK
jgi:hypothetical protein